MDEIAVGIIDLKTAQTRFEGGPDALWAMVGVPQLGGDEQLFPSKRPRPDRFAYRDTHLFFVAVPFRAIEMSKPHLQCDLGGRLGGNGVGNERAEPDSRYRTLPKRDP